MARTATHKYWSALSACLAAMPAGAHFFAMGRMIFSLLVFLHGMVLIGLVLIGWSLYLVFGQPATVGYAGIMLIVVAVALIWYLEART